MMNGMLFLARVDITLASLPNGYAGKADGFVCNRSTPGGYDKYKHPQSTLMLLDLYRMYFPEKLKKSE